MVRGALIVIVGEGCSQQLGQESNQCALGNLEDAVKIEGHRVLKTDMLFEMKNRPSDPPSLVLHPEHLPPFSGKHCCPFVTMC